jgi:poly(hydroxyalkanoate) depolymerase family esterase
MWQQYEYNDAHGSRPYFVYTPEHYQPGTKVPLLVMLHGCSQTAHDFAIGTSMNDLAERYGFIVLYPQQTQTHNLGGCWNWFSPEHQQRGKGEPASIAGIIQAVQARSDVWTIDPERIYAAGLSAGGAMAVILGATYPDLIAAIGVHSGMAYQAASSIHSGVLAMRYGGPDPLRQGELAYSAMGARARIVPTIVFHGTDDKVAAPVNGDQVVEQWMHTNFLASSGAYLAYLDTPTTRTSGQTPDGYSYLVFTWSLPDGDEVQAYWKVAGLGHAWSGGHPRGSFTDPLGPDASLAMYQFFMAHPLSGSQVRVQTRSLRWWSPKRLFAKLFRRRRPH